MEFKPQTTLKRRKLVKELATSETLKEAGIKAGYHIEQGSRQIYRPSTRKHIELELAKMGYSEDAIKKEFERLSALAESKNDFSNAMRGKENIARIMGLFKDKTELTTKSSVDSTQTSEDMLKEIKSRLAGKLDTLNITKPQE